MSEAHGAQGGQGAGGTGQAAGGQGGAQGGGQASQGAGGGLLEGGGQGGAAGFDWKGALGEQFQAFEPTIKAKGWKGPADALKAYNEAQKFIGADPNSRLILPGKDAKPEEVAAFWGKLGRPEAPGNYKFPQIEGVTTDPALEGPWQAVFHAANVPQSMMEKLYAGAAKLMGEQVAAQKAELEKATATMRAQTAAEFGEKFDAARVMAKRAAAAAGLTDEDTAAIYKAGPGVERAMFRILARLGEGIKEDTAAGGDSGGMSAQDAQAEINKLYGDPEFMRAYKEKGHPQHNDSVEKMEKLFKARWPTPQRAA